MAHRDLWGTLDRTDVDVALLQEAGRPRPGAVLEVLPSENGAWTTAGWPTRHWRTAVARLTDRVTLSSRPTSAMHEVTSEGAGL